MSKKSTKKVGRKMDALNILRRAKSALERKGWTRGALVRGEQLCSLGAVNFSVTGDGRNGPLKTKEGYKGHAGAVDALNRVAKEAGHGFGIVNFNDHYATSSDDVLEMFDRAINLARRES